MAFDSVFQGPPSDIAAPGTAQSPSLGVDVTNKELYISAGAGWEELSSGGGGGIPAGTDGELQYNNSGAFGGAGITDGSHFAMGDGAVVDPNGVPTVLGLEETMTSADATGLQSLLVYNPTIDPVIGAQAIYGEVDFDCDGTTDPSPSNIFAGDIEAYNHSDTKKVNEFGGIRGYSDSPGNGNVATQYGVQAWCDKSGSGTTDALHVLHVKSPGISGVVTELIGLSIDDQTGGVTNYAIRTGKGIVQFGDIVRSGVVYSVAGTPLPSAATSGIGARAFVSDAVANTFNTAYVGSGANKVPVFSDGTIWHIG